MFKLNKKILSTSMVLMLMASSLGVVEAQSKGLKLESAMCKEQGKFLKNMDSERAVDYVKILSEEIGPRIAGTEEEYEAALFLQEEFNKLGYKTEIQEFEYTRNNVTTKSWNVEAVRKPKGNDKADTNEIVYVTAHYDSVKNAPGANDNASGVAAMLEVANSIQNMDIDREIRFVACGAEEVGLQGSSAYVNSLTEDEISRSVGSFNMDMVATAYEPASELAVYTSNGQRNVITDAVADAGSKLAKYSNSEVSFDGEHELTPEGKLVAMGSSDHVPFTKAGIPAALFINVDPSKKHDPRAAIEPYYHKPEDYMLNFSEDRLERTIALIGSAIYETVDVDHHKDKEHKSSKISIENMMNDLTVMANRDNSRVTGFAGEHETADYLINEFNKMGLDAKKDKIDGITGYIAESTTVKVDGKAIASKLFTYSNPTNGVVEGEVVNCGLGRVEDLENIDLEGKIALVQRGEISFGEKVQYASEKGATAVIIYNNAEGDLNGTLGSANSKLAPSASISKTDGENLKQRIENGEQVTLSLENKAQVAENSYSYNVVARIPASNKPEKAQTIVVGAHMDGVQCAAANDNATGTASIVEAARILSSPEVSKNLKYNIEFVAFGAEEIGLIGSKQYVKTLQDTNQVNDVRAMINLDMVGVGNNLVMYNSNNATSHEITDLAKEVGDTLGYLNKGTSQDLHSTSSDHAPFEAVGIPSTFLTYRMSEAGGLDPYYHRKSDTIQTVSPQYLYNTTDVVVKTVLELQKHNHRPDAPQSVTNYSVEKLETEDFLTK